MSIMTYPGAPTSVRHAVHRLATWTGIPSGGGGPRIVVELNAAEKAGEQGYSIRGTKGGYIRVSGSHESGLANGVYTLLRNLMIEHRTDPFSRDWSIEETPHFRIRGFTIAPYRFGASFGFATLSPDRWSIDEWKEHIDFLRLCNINRLTLCPYRMYHPDYPQSHREAWRYQIWKQVMDYCHHVGMEFHWLMSPNLVCEQAFWDNPELRAIQDKAAWYGNGLIWHKAKEFILNHHRHTLEFFSEIDGLEMLFSDGGGFSFDQWTGADPAGYFADATKSYIKLMREVGNDGSFVFWNWGLDIWAKVLLPESETTRYPKYLTIQDDVMPLLPDDVQWIDPSMLTWIMNYGHLIRGRGNPPLREGVLLGRERGFKPVIDFFWYTNPEYSINIFPHPYLKRTIQEAAYARDELQSDGVGAYRLAPPCRMIGDYAFCRLASNPGLTEEEIIAETAGLLCANAVNRERVSQGIRDLEKFWSTHSMDDLGRAESAFRTAAREEESVQLERVSHGTSFLQYVVRLAQPGLSEIEKEAIRHEAYEAAKHMKILQGLVSDIVWTPEAIRFFNARINMMVEDLTRPLYRDSPFPEYVERSIYPHATAEPVVLDWSGHEDDYRMDPVQSERRAMMEHDPQG